MLLLLFVDVFKDNAAYIEKQMKKKNSHNNSNYKVNKLSPTLKHDHWRKYKCSLTLKKFLNISLHFFLIFFQFFPDVAWDREILSLKGKNKMFEKGCKWKGELRLYKVNLCVPFAVLMILLQELIDR